MRSGELDDEACLRALGADSDRAFEVLFERYSDAVYNVAFRRTASWSAAEDITENVFLELWRQRRRVVLLERSIRPWLFGVAANQARRWWRESTRKAKAVERLAGREQAAGAAGGDELADRVAARVDDERRMAGLLNAIRQLPEAQQDVLSLWAWEQLSYEEIAVALGLRVGTVKSRLSRARAALEGIEGDEAIDGTATGLRASTVEPPNRAAPVSPPGAEQQGGSR
jgi:RNA polymerase sigma-70 factor (ECF subfamily)